MNLNNYNVRSSAIINAARRASVKHKVLNKKGVVMSKIGERNWNRGISHEEVSIFSLIKGTRGNNNNDNQEAKIQGSQMLTGGTCTAINNNREKVQDFPKCPFRPVDPAQPNESNINVHDEARRKHH
ncbi:unnamed protein product [Nezara viridula]|uniref:Uncharacterized protein n=1 Tax=Nezara viridula TaxID=85310 RepID=A0A9P0MMG8_NEZVI|nr:unnamed protein product [Nezara viridula]